MDNEGIKQIIELAQKQELVLKVPGDSRAHYVRKPEGNLEKVIADLEPVNLTVFDTKSLMELVTSQRKLANLELGNYYVTVNNQGVCGVAELNAYRIAYKLNLPLHPAFAKVLELRKSQTFNQKELVKLLRSVFGGMIDLTVVAQYRSIKMSSKSNAAANIQSGMSGISRSIVDEVVAENGEMIPEQITLSVPVFDTPEFRDEKYLVTVLVATDFTENGAPSFELTTVHNEAANAQQRALEFVTQTIAAHEVEGVPIYQASF